MRGHYLAAAAAFAVAAACAQPSPTAAQDADALGFFHLGQSGEGRVSFASSRNVRGGEELSDVTITGDDGMNLHADTLRITGVRDTRDGPVFDALVLDGLSASDGSDGFTLDRVTIDKPNAPLARVVAAMFSQGSMDDFEWGKPSDYGFDSIAFEGFNTDADGGQVSVETLRLTGLDAGTLDRLEVENVAAEGDDPKQESFSFGLGSWRMNGVDMSGADAFADADIEDPEDFQAALQDSGFNNPFVKRFDDYEFKDATLDVNGVMVALDGLTGTARQTRRGIATDETLDNLKVTFDAAKPTGAQALAMLSQLGYDALEINGHFAQNADERADRVSTDDYAIEATDAFRLELDYDIAGVAAYLQAAAAEGWRPGSSMDDPEIVARVFGPLVINAFELRLIDKSLVQRAFAAAAVAQGVPEEQIRAQTTAMMTMGTMMTPPGPLQALTAQAVQAATSFLEEPGTLRITVAPAQPVSIGELITAFDGGDSEAALNLLNLEIAAE